MTYSNIVLHVIPWLFQFLVEKLSQLFYCTQLPLVCWLILLIGVTIGGGDDQAEMLNNSWDDCTVTSVEMLCWLKRWCGVQLTVFLLFCLHVEYFAVHMQRVDIPSIGKEADVLYRMQFEPWTMCFSSVSLALRRQHLSVRPYSAFLLEMWNTSLCICTVHISLC